MEVHIAGQRTEIVHHAIDAEVVAVLLILVVVGISSTHRCLLVQRDLTHTVDGVVGIVHCLGHTVLGTHHHHTTTKDAAEV